MTHNEDRDDLLTELTDEEGADDTRELQEPCATPNSLFSILQKEYNGLLVNDTTPVEDIPSRQSLHTLQDHINHVKENQKLARTGRIWLMLIQIVPIIRMFIRSERAGNWYINLKATRICCPTLLQLATTTTQSVVDCMSRTVTKCHDMCACLKKPLEEGAFTIHRNENLFWSGTWTGMTIEQSLMRSGKTHGGLVNITHKESAMTKWLLTAHIAAQYSEADRKEVLGLSSTNSCIKAVACGTTMTCKSSWCFCVHTTPFTSDDPTQLRNISTGLVADHRVNVDYALTIGAKIQERLTGKRFGHNEKEGPDPEICYHEEANQSRWRRCAHVTCAGVLPATLHCPYQWST